MVVGSHPLSEICALYLVISFSMPIKKSAVKAMNRSQVLAKRNYDFKLRMKMAIKKFLKAVEAKEELTIENLSEVFKAIDKAAKVGVIKREMQQEKRLEFQRHLILWKNSLLRLMPA